jgi:hypothetical protein
MLIFQFFICSYHEAGMIAGNIEVLQHLNDVTLDFIREFPAM